MCSVEQGNSPHKTGITLTKGDGMMNYRIQEKDFPRLSARRLLKKSEIKDFTYKIMGMEFFDRSIL
jgi:hypothetical protein